MQTISPPLSIEGAANYYLEDYQANSSFSDSPEKASGGAVESMEPGSPVESNDEPIVNTAREKTAGEWHGTLMADLNLPKFVTRRDFGKLVRAEHPITGEQLIRHVKPREKRDNFGKLKMTSSHRAGWDLTFSAPKSVSLAALVGGDERIIEAHRHAVNKALTEDACFIEARMGNIKPSQRTGKGVFAVFLHEAARPDAKNGYAAPDLHSHAFLCNFTRTADGKYRAIQPYELFVNQKFATAIYRSELARELKDIGYQIRVDEQTGAPEINGISRAYIEASSPRQREIKQTAKSLGISNTKKIAQLNRPRKNFDREAMRQRQMWLENAFGNEAQLAMQKAQANRNQTISPSALEQQEKVTQAVGDAIRQATAKPEQANWRTMVTHALQNGMGAIVFDEVRAEIELHRQAGNLKNFDLEKRITRKAAKQPTASAAQAIVETEVAVASPIAQNQPNKETIKEPADGKTEEIAESAVSIETAVNSETKVNSEGVINNEFYRIVRETPARDGAFEKFGETVESIDTICYSATERRRISDNSEPDFQRAESAGVADSASDAGQRFIESGIVEASFGDGKSFGEDASQAIVSGDSSDKSVERNGAEPQNSASESQSSASDTGGAEIEGDNARARRQIAEIRVEIQSTAVAITGNRADHKLAAATLTGTGFITNNERDFNRRENFESDAGNDLGQSGVESACVEQPKILVPPGTIRDEKFGDDGHSTSARQPTGRGTVERDQPDGIGDSERYISSGGDGNNGNGIARDDRRNPDGTIAERSGTRTERTGIIVNIGGSGGEFSNGQSSDPESSRRADEDSFIASPNPGIGGRKREPPGRYGSFGTMGRSLLEQGDSRFTAVEGNAESFRGDEPKSAADFRRNPALDAATTGDVRVFEETAGSAARARAETSGRAELGSTESASQIGTGRTSETGESAARRAAQFAAGNPANTAAETAAARTETERLDQQSERSLGAEPSADSENRHRELFPRLHVDPFQNSQNRSGFRDHGPELLRVAGGQEKPLTVEHERGAVRVSRTSIPGGMDSGAAGNHSRASDDQTRGRTNLGAAREGVDEFYQLAANSGEISGPRTTDTKRVIANPNAIVPDDFHRGRDDKSASDESLSRQLLANTYNDDTQYDRRLYQGDGIPQPENDRQSGGILYSEKPAQPVAESERLNFLLDADFPSGINDFNGQEQLDDSDKHLALDDRHADRRSRFSDSSTDHQFDYSIQELDEAASERILDGFRRELNFALDQIEETRTVDLIWSDGGIYAAEEESAAREAASERERIWSDLIQNQTEQLQPFDRATGQSSRSAAAESVEQSFAANERHLLDEQQQAIEEAARTIQTGEPLVQIQQMETGRLIDVEEYETAAETARELQPFPAVAHNTTLIDPYAEAEAKENAFWQKERQEREARNAVENAARRVALTLEERAAEDQAMIEEAEAEESGMSEDLILSL